MGMSSYVVGFRPADKKWEEMLAIWNMCKKAKVAIPEEVIDFFDDCDPNGKPGLDVSLPEDAVEEYNHDKHCQSGYTVDVSKLPKDVRYVRFINSW